jgi:hypothetical protein
LRGGKHSATDDNVGLTESFFISAELCNAHVGIKNFCF